MSKKKKQIKSHKNEFLERRKTSIENITYSLHRLDILIITISGGGLYTCFETGKFLVEKNKETLSLIATYPAKLFVLSIIANLLSQYTGYLANKFDCHACDEELRVEGKKDELTQQAIAKYNSKALFNSFWTEELNLASLTFLGLGLLFLMTFYSKIIS